jgi:hypothetical protein
MITLSVWDNCTKLPSAQSCLGTELRVVYLCTCLYIYGFLAGDHGVRSAHGCLSSQYPNTQKLIRLRTHVTTTHVYSCSRVDIRHWLPGGQFSIRIPVGTKHFLFSITVQTGCGAYQTSYYVVLCIWPTYVLRNIQSNTTDFLYYWHLLERRHVSAFSNRYLQAVYWMNSVLECYANGIPCTYNFLSNSYTTRPIDGLKMAVWKRWNLSPL